MATPYGAQCSALLLATHSTPPLHNPNLLQNMTSQHKYDATTQRCNVMHEPNRKSKVHKIILVGGSTHIPHMIKLISDFSMAKSPTKASTLIRPLLKVLLSRLPSSLATHLRRHKISSLMPLSYC